MSVYVGKDVTVKIQVPVDREQKNVPGGPPYKVTLSKGPISDLNQNGVANEVAHITVVDEIGNTVTPIDVNDTAKEVTFSAGDAGKTVYITYRYDFDPFVAQELTVEPRQVVEGLDALGSDTIQHWACLVREISGSVKEALKPGDDRQLRRVEALADNHVELYGMIVTLNQGGSAVKIGLDKVTFPEGSIHSPKNAPVFIVTPFKARTVKTIN